MRTLDELVAGRTAEDEADPTEERGPEYCESEHEQCEIGAGQLDAPPEGSEAQFVSELDEAYAPEPELCVPHPLDGLPVPAGEGSPLAVAPAFTVDNLLCVADERQFVEVFHDELIELLEELSPTLMGEIIGRVAARGRFDESGVERDREILQPADVEKRWGLWVHKQPLERKSARWPFGQVEVRYRVVRPIRERCKHYCCQTMNNDEVTDPSAFGHRIVFRNCKARRSVGGALMSLRDQAVYSCDYRCPADERSRSEFEAKESERLSGRAHERLIPFLELKPKEG